MSEEQKALSDVLDENASKEKEEQETEEAQQSAEDAEPAPEQPEQQEDAEEKDDEEQAEPAEEEPKSEKEPEEKEQKEPEKQQAKKAFVKKEAPRSEEPARREAPRPKKGLDANVVLVGKKPTMSYVLAAVTQFSDGMDQIHLKARGRSISRAVDVAEVVRNRFVQGLSTDVQIGTQEITDENNNKINVSTIDITLKK
jgi:DNA-binding protein